MIKNMSINEVRNVSGAMCTKTILETTSSILTGTGLTLQGFGQALHATLPNLSDPAQKWTPQAYVGLTIGIVGLVLNCASAAISAYAASIPTCPNDVK